MLRKCSCLYKNCVIATLGYKYNYHVTNIILISEGILVKRGKVSHGCDRHPTLKNQLEIHDFV